MSGLHKSTEIRLTHPDGWSYVINDDEGGEIVEIGYQEPSARRNHHREHFRKTVETRLPWLTASQIQKALEQGKAIHIHRSFEWPPAPVDWDDC